MALACSIPDASSNWWLHQASILGQLRHPNIVEELGVLTRSKDDILIILKLCDTVLKTYVVSRLRKVPPVIASVVPQFYLERFLLLI